MSEYTFQERRGCRADENTHSAQHLGLQREVHRAQYTRYSHTVHEASVRLVRDVRARVNMRM